MEEITISYDSDGNLGILSPAKINDSNVWDRLVSSALNYDPNATVVQAKIRLPWYQLLSILREYSPLQRQLGFKFVTDQSSKELVHKFIQETKVAIAARNQEIVQLTEEEIKDRLIALGFEKRDLKWFQKRDVARLVSIPSGANFSVPGAGKTTVALAIHLLTCSKTDKLLVVCPKAAFTAWDEIIEACVGESENWAFEKEFTNLSRLDDRALVDTFNSADKKFFYTNYENFASRKEIFGFLLSTNATHLVLDESHRMKAGQFSQRGAALLSVANLPKRKDILSGTPMPQDSYDLQAQLDFLWPGSSLGLRVQKGENPSTVIDGLFTRTTKEELGLPPAKRKFVKVQMTSAQAALYGIVKNDVLRQLSSFRDGRGGDIIRARKSVMRLLQLGSNPILAIRGISQDIFLADHALINAIVQDPRSPKIEEVCRIVRENKGKCRKTVVWTIFTQNILDLERELSDLNPVSLYGEVPSGEATDDSTREGRLRKFHIDSTCWVMIANPAAAGEGISLHEVCHEAVYLDRSYVSTHYLQSIDRIHRLGLKPGTETNITIVQIASPAGLGSIDFSVSRRLALKIRALEQLLNDHDLHLIALDEENAQEPIDYTVDVQDIADLINELEGRVEFDEEQGV